MYKLTRTTISIFLVSLPLLNANSSSDTSSEDDLTVFTRLYISGEEMKKEKEKQKKNRFVDITTLARI